MRRYKNTKTGAVIEVEGRITAGNWEELVAGESQERETVGDSGEPSYKELQQKAKGYGINPFGKDTETLKQMIAEYEAAQSSEVAPVQQEEAAVEKQTSGTVIKARRDS